MPAEIVPILLWTLIREIEIPSEIYEIMTPGEEPWASFATIRDSATFTNKRLILRDAQGLTGSKVEIYSLPYKEIIMWSSENAGAIIDRNAEMELWTKAGHIKVRLNKGVDIRKIDRIISTAILA